MSSLSQKIQRQQFHPGLLGVFVNPFYLMRGGLLQSVSDLAPQITGRTLDIGCGSKPYAELFTASTEYVGMDYDSPDNRKNTKADFFYDGEHFPFPDKSFDSAIATEVMEHVFNPNRFLAEAYRVLKPGGKFLLTTPFAWDEHAQPYDYARYSSFGLEHLLVKHGFEVVERRKTAADIRALCQLTACYIHKSIPFKGYKARLIVYVILISPLTILGKALWRILPKNQDLYLSNVVLARKI